MRIDEKYYMIHYMLNRLNTKIKVNKIKKVFQLANLRLLVKHARRIGLNYPYSL